jgi:hypothetical protein
MKDHTYFIVRLVGALGGCVGGAFAGVLGFIVIIISTGATFGLHNIWPAAIAGSAIGCLLGFLFPRVGKSLSDLFIGLG